MRRRRVLAKRYELLNEVGVGATGIVYRARDRRKRQIVAVKVLHAWLAINPYFVDRFQREAAIAKDLKSSGIASVLDHGSDGYAHFIVMEFVRGVTLQELLEERGPIAPSATLTVVIQIAQALATAHAKGIIHRDIKPANIKILEDGSVKLLDFGIATGDDAVTMTAEGTALGTVRYVAPEQVESRADARSDIYSLGAVAYHMLAGCAPFQADNLWAVIEMHRHVEPPALTRADVTQPLGNLVMECLRKAPDERFQNMEEFLQACRGVQEASGWATAPPLTSSASWGLRLKRLIRRVSIRRTLSGSARLTLRGILLLATLVGLAIIGAGIALSVVVGMSDPPKSGPTGAYDVELSGSRTCWLLVIDESATNCGGDLEECEAEWIDRFDLEVDCDAGTTFQMEEKSYGDLDGQCTIGGQATQCEGQLHSP